MKNIIRLTMLILLSVAVCTAYAAPYSSSRSSSSSFGRSSFSSGGFSKPSSSGSFSKPSTAPIGKPSSSGGFFKSTTTTNPAAKASGGFTKSTPSDSSKAFTPAHKPTYNKDGSVLNKAINENKSSKALKSYDEKKLPKQYDRPIYKRYQSTYNPQDYTRKRTEYYRTRTVPHYVHYSQPSFGMWDAMLLWMVLDNLNDPNQYGMMYHHANDPGMKEWRAEAEKQAATNIELQSKLNELDAKVAAMKGTPLNETYLPANVPAEAAIVPMKDAWWKSTVVLNTFLAVIILLFIVGGVYFYSRYVKLYR